MRASSQSPIACIDLPAEIARASPAGETPEKFLNGIRSD
jgi:hypothetical protein